MLKSLDFYILKQIMPTLLITLMVSAIILLLERMLRLLDLVVGNGVSTFVVVQMLFNLIPYYIGLALPVALFLGVLLAFRKLSSQSELDAILSTGIGLSRVIRVAVLLGLFMMIFNLILVGYLQPYSRYAYRLILFNISSGVLETGIGEGVFMNLPNDYTLRVQEARRAGKELYGVFAHHQSEDGTIVTLTAKRGRLITGGLDGKTNLRLYQGSRNKWSPGSYSSETISFEVFDWPLNLEKLVQFRVRGGDERELTLSELLDSYLSNGILKSKNTNFNIENSIQKNKIDSNAIKAELHSRIVISLSILVLPLLAASMGIMTRRSSRSFGLVFGLILIVVYHEILEFFEAIASVGFLAPVIALWTPFFLFLSASSYLFLKTEMVSGTTPVQNIEDKWSNFYQSIINLIREKSK